MSSLKETLDDKSQLVSKLEGELEDLKDSLSLSNSDGSALREQNGKVRRRHFLSGAHDYCLVDINVNKTGCFVGFEA